VIHKLQRLARAFIEREKARRMVEAWLEEAYDGDDGERVFAWALASRADAGADVIAEED
jgi:hypothetical protein